jgi:hypothetical protein
VKGIVLHCERIFIPRTLRKEMMIKAHEGHFIGDNGNGSPSQGTHVVAGNGQSAGRICTPMWNLCAVQTSTNERTTYDD